MKIFDKKTIKNGSFGIISDRDVNLNIINIDATDSDLELSTRLVQPRHYRSRIALELFKLKAYTVENLSSLVLDSRTADELQFSLRFSRGTSYKNSRLLVKDLNIQNHIRFSAISSIEDKDYLSLISLVSVCSALSLDFGISLLDVLPMQKLPESVWNLLKKLKITLKKTKLILVGKNFSDIETPLNVSVDTHDDYIEYSITDSDITHTVHNPQLLWDCNCDSNEKTSFYQIEKTCKIHGEKEGVIISLFMGTPHIIAINRQKFLSYSGPVWPPSIDSILFLKSLNYIQKEIESNKIDTMIDIGCGVGVLGIYFRNLFPSIKKCIFIDSDPDAISIARYNYKINSKNDNNAIFIQTDFVSSLADVNINNDPKKTIILCLPPYLPYPDTTEGKYLKKVAYNGLNGLELLQAVINDFKKLASYMVIGFSEMANKFTYYNHNINLKPIFTEVVPLRIPSVLHRPDFVEWLKKEKLIYLRKDKDHLLWHKLTIYSNFDY